MNIGVIGCGKRISKVLGWLLNVNPAYKIEGVFDISRDSIAKFKSKFGSDINEYDSYENLASSKNIDWIFIGSTNHVHKDQILFALKSNKHIFAEKPLATNIEDCLEIKKAFENKNLNFIISYPLRHSRHYLRIKESIDRGDIGEIISIEFNEILPFNHGGYIMSDWRRYKEISGGHILEKCCHDIDIVNWIVGSLAKKVCSFGGLNFFIEKNSNLIEDLDEEKEDFEGKLKWSENPFVTKKDIIDNQVSIIEYYNGVRASFHTNLSSGIPERRMIICGSKGSIRSDVLKGEIEIKGIKPSDKSIKICDEEFKGSHGGGDEFLVKEINRAMISEKPVSWLNDSIKSAVTAIEIDKSREEGMIRDLENVWRRFEFSNKA